jgi:uncharacterized damage-inducible protein DinB
MPARIEVLDFKPTPGRSKAAMAWVAHLDDQTKLLVKDLEDITPAELQWQVKPGMNTIGMLLAHVAIVEMFWMGIAERVPDPDAPVAKGLGIGPDDDGMPLKPGGTPPGGLDGQPFKYYLKLIQRARLHTRKVVRGYRDTDLARSMTRTRRNGQRQRLSVRWILYHVAEHFSGHYGQILLLRHLYRDRGSTR